MRAAKSPAPPSDALNALIAAAIFFASLIFYLLTMSKVVGVYDEGLILTATMRVAAGEVPHRDFYFNYGPGQLYILAGLFKLFGQTVFVERVYDAVIRAAITAACYRLLAG
jgi:hypothetical protein